MTKYVNEIVNKRLHCYFISPHLDDAALSAGGLITYLAKKTKVTVITVFTRANNHSSLSAKAYLKQCKYNNSLLLYRDRRKEDRKAYNSIDVPIHHLGYTEALWRTKSSNSLTKLLSKIIPEINCLYPIYRLHITSGKINKKDIISVVQIAERLKKIIGNSQKNVAIFTSLGIGNHVDHLITRSAVEYLWKPVYWLDQPYCNTYAIPFNKRNHDYFYNISEKRDLCLFYKSQIVPLFGSISCINDIKEAFIFSDNDRGLL